MTDQALTFVPSDSIAQQTAATFSAHAQHINERLPEVEVRHHGGSSAPGLVTSGDVDLHVRTGAEGFPTARDTLAELYEPVLEWKWNDEVAYFVDYTDEPPVEVVLTLVGSLDDRFHKDAWERLLADPELVRRYNAIKHDHEGGVLDEYKAAKREFFWEIVRSLD